MNTLLFAGDTILEWRSHQSALVQALADGKSISYCSYHISPSVRVCLLLHL